MKTLELPKMDAIGSEKQKSRLISKYVNILSPEIGDFYLPGVVCDSSSNQAC